MDTLKKNISSIRTMGFVLEICDVKNTQGNSHKLCVCVCVCVCFVCHHTGNHPQEELAKFGYKSERKVEKFKIPAYILATC
jgi:hypothetical protein